MFSRSCRHGIVLPDIGNLSIRLHGGGSGLGLGSSPRCLHPSRDTYRHKKAIIDIIARYSSQSSLRGCGVATRLARSPRAYCHSDELHICRCHSISGLDAVIHLLIRDSTFPSFSVVPSQTFTQSADAMAPVATTLVSETSGNATVGAIGKTTSGKPLKVRAYPKFDSLEEERLYRKQHLAAAYRVFAERGFDEGVAGHISVRDPILTDHFCKFYATCNVMRGCNNSCYRAESALETLLANLRERSHSGQ